MNLKTCLLAIVVTLAVAVPAVAASSAFEDVDTTLDVTRADVSAARADIVPGEAIVRFEPGTTARERGDAREASGVVFERSAGVPRAQVVDVEGSVMQAVKRLEQQPDVAYAQPNFRYHATASAPNDPLFPSLWGLEDTPTPNPGVNALAAWDTTRGADQVIAVLDTGVALDHPDIDLWDKVPDGTHGFDFVDNDTIPDDYDFHGTHVAGTAAAIDDNSIGIAGVAPDAEVMAVRVLDGNGSGSTDDIAAGIQFAALNGADVINMSLGGPAGDGDQLMQDAITVADAAGTVVVVAAGNETSDNDSEPTTPCTLPNPNLICVAAVDQAGALAGFSNFGKTTVDVAAPGTGILSAETDYLQVFQNGLDDSTGWGTAVSNGGVPWALTTSPRTEGSHSASDSPVTVGNPSGRYGRAVDPNEYAESDLIRTTGIDLTGKSGCRLVFDARYEIEYGYDYLAAGAIDAVDGQFNYFTGSSGGSFFEESASISTFDGRTGVQPAFALLSDYDVEFDGAYVDDVRVLCRDSSYTADNYVSFNGTSMATPHVAGVVALLKAAKPGASNAQIVQAVKAGVLQLPSLKCKTVTGGTVDAAAALAALAAGSSPPDGCPLPPPSGGTSTTPTSPPPPAPQAPSRPSFAGSPASLRASKRGVFKYTFRATPGLTGNAVFKTRKKAVVSRKAHLTIARRAFTVASTGKVTLKVKLSRKHLRVLRRNRKLFLKVTATVRNASGLSASGSNSFTLTAPPR